MMTMMIIVSCHVCIDHHHLMMINDQYIQGGQKKLHTELMAITLSILDGFSKFFHC